LNKTIILIILILILPIALAEDFFIKQGATTDIKMACFDNNNDFCDSNTNCSLTINNPNMISIINNQNMTYNPNYYNYTIHGSNLTLLGAYYGTMQCQGADYSGKTPFTFKSTISGIEITEAETTNNLPIIISMIVGILFFGMLGFFTKFEKTKSLLFGIKFMSLGVALIELVFLMFIIYAFNSEFHLNTLLRINFYIMLIVGMMLGFVSIYMNAITFMKIAPQEESKEKWEKDRWQ